MTLASPGIAGDVVRWQRSHGRHALPWQNTRDPYRVWLSEIMLQQTQVSVVLGYYELFLRRNLHRAQLVSTQGNDAAFALLSTGQAEALAGLFQALLGSMAKLPGSRMVDGRFMGVQQSIAVPKGRDAGLAYLRRVVEDAKVSGLVARAIERTGARGVSVAPLAP